MSILVGSTGFVGGHLLRSFKFDKAIHRANLRDIEGANTELLVCAGLPAEKWKANQEPQVDWLNTVNLAQTLGTVKSNLAILISTIDVYQPAINVSEHNSPTLNGEGAYGRNRAWFEIFFQSHFENSIVLRLPGLFASDLKKNLIYDLMNSKFDQLEKVNSNSKFQFFNVMEIWSIIQSCISKNISLLNITTEPITAGEIANLFNLGLGTKPPEIFYDVRSIHDKKFNGGSGYLYTKEKILSQISDLRTYKANHETFNI